MKATVTAKGAKVIVFDPLSIEDDLELFFRRPITRTFGRSHVGSLRIQMGFFPITE